LRVTRKPRSTAPATPLRELLPPFLEDLRRQDRATATVRSYGHDLELFLRWWEGQGAPVLAALDAARYRDRLVDGRRHKPATIHRRMESLRRFLRWGAEKGHLEAGLEQPLRPVPRPPRHKPKSLGDAEIQALLRAAGASGRGLALRNYALVQMLVQTGLRVGETAEVRVEDATVRERTGLVCVREGKGRRPREVPLNTAARRGLRRWLESRQPLDPEAPLFVSERGGPMSVRALQHTLAEIARRAGLEPGRVTCHAMRHTFATRYLRRHPGKLVELASLLGHESLDTTAIYTRASLEELAADLESASSPDDV